MSDEELFELCKRWGGLALESRQKFCGLLPEVYKRRLYERKGFVSIHEFAAKLAGISHEQVNTILCLDRRFEDKPVLKAALREGKISVNKLARIVSIATAENQNEIFSAGINLSKAALEVFVKDFKNGCKDGFAEPENCEKKKLVGLFERNKKEKCGGFWEPSNGVQSLPGQEAGMDGEDNVNGANDAQKPSNYDYEILAAISPELKQKIKELMDKGHDINSLLMEFFAEREEKIEQKKIILSEAQRQEQRERAVISMPVSRYVPVKIRQIIKEEHGSRCSIPGCRREAKVLHHAARFAIARVHAPRFLAPLCAGHHELAHRVDIKAGGWRGKM